jgi:hypothetical protein
LVSSDEKARIFIQRKIWGLTSDQQITVISNSPNGVEKPDSTINFVFEGLEPFVYHLESDTLRIYTMAPSPTPAKFDSSKIKVIQVKISNTEYMDLIYKINISESDLETGWNHFELRRLIRWWGDGRLLILRGNFFNQMLVSENNAVIEVRPWKIYSFECH